MVKFSASQMPHEDPALVGGEGSSVENGVFSSVTPLSPTLSAKLKAKKLSRRKIGKVSLHCQHNNYACTP